MVEVDLNADLGEGEVFSSADLGVLGSVTSVSLACGFHAGNRRVMRAAAAASLSRGVIIGAHVSFRDRDGFGRRTIDVQPTQLVNDIVEQCAVLSEEVDAAGGTVAYVKPHGALYNRMGADPIIAASVVEAVSRQNNRVLVAQAGTAVVEVALRAGLRVVLEGFPDRGYLADGRLVPRRDPGARVDDPSVAAQRAVSLVIRGGVEAIDGAWAQINVETLCIHGDAPNAADAARRVRSALEAEGITLRPFHPVRAPRVDGRTTAVIARVTPYGDNALVVEVDDVSSAHLVAATIDESQRGGRAPAGIEETVVGFRSVVVHLDPESDQPELVEEWLTELASRAVTAAAPSSGPPTATAAPGRRHVEIPATFDGPDLEAVASIIGRTPARVVELLTGAQLQVAFLGFAPGFPYLIGLPPELASIPRRTTPRASVPAGSVAVGGGFASVYPQATPGGWMLLGRTSARLFDPDHPPYAFLRSGDAVRFTVHAPGIHGGGASSPGAPPSPRAAPADTPSPPGSVPRASGAGAATPQPRPLLAARGDRFVEILDPGLLSLIEDGGRRSVASMGVPRAGPADPEAMRLANRLVGNHDGSATIEVTAVGPRLRFTGDAHLGVVASSPDGLEVRIDGHPVGAGVVSPVRHGQVVTIGRIHGGLRAYVAVSGGIETPMVVGSRSTDLLSGLGPGPLMAGDRLDLGLPSRPHGQLMRSFDPSTRLQPTVVRVIDGPHHLPPTERDLLVSSPWTVGDASNRIGVRLTRRHRSIAPAEAGIPSFGMVTGAVQLPPDGNPIILMPDHATVGGYPVIACVISVDLPLVGQLRPGDTVTFTYVDRRTARSELKKRERMLAGRVTGWFPTRAGT
jgi:KipI family sensor histidine kinase inhibitor